LVMDKRASNLWRSVESLSWTKIVKGL